MRVMVYVVSQCFCYRTSRAKNRREGTRAETNAVLSDRCKRGALPLVQPGGAPRVTEGDAAVETDVTSMPSEVRMKVTRVGDGESVGIAGALT